MTQEDIAKELYEAIKPFAALLHDHYAHALDERPVFGICGSLIDVGNLRNANKAIAAYEASITEPLDE